MASELGTKQSSVLAALLIVSFLLIVFISGRFNDSDLAYPAAKMGTIDLIAFWSASRLFLEGGNPYDLASMLHVEQSVYPDQLVVGFLNPPWSLPWYSLICWLPFHVVRAAFLLLNFSSLLVMLALGKKLGNARSYAVTVITGLWFLPALKAIWMGQVSGILTTSLLLGYYCYQREKLLLSSIFTFPLFIKPHLFLPVFVWWGLTIVVRDRNIRWCAYLSLVGALSMVLAYLINPQVFSYWLEVDKGPLEYRTVTLVTAIRDLTLSYSGTFIYWPLSVVPVLGTLGSLIFFYKDRWIGHPDSVPLLLTLSCGLAPFCFFYDYIALLPMHYVLMTYALEMPEIKRRYAVLLAMAPQFLVLLFSSISSDASALYWFPWTYLLFYIFMSRGRMAVKHQEGGLRQ